MVTFSEQQTIREGTRLKVSGGKFYAIAKSGAIQIVQGVDYIATNYGLIDLSLIDVIKLPRLYLAGPRTGLPNNNYPEFNRIADYLRRQGFHVENPAENDLPESSSWADYMRAAIGQLIKCDVVVQLEGWEKSEGARLETDIALRLKILTIPYASDEFVNWLQRTVEG